MTALYFLYLSLDRLHCNCASGFKMQREVDSETSESRSKTRQTETKGSAPVLREASGSCSPKTIRVLLVSDSHFVRGSEDVIGQTSQWISQRMLWIWGRELDAAWKRFMLQCVCSGFTRQQQPAWVCNYFWRTSLDFVLSLFVHTSVTAF